MVDPRMAHATAVHTKIAMIAAIRLIMVVCVSTLSAAPATYLSRLALSSTFRRKVGGCPRLCLAPCTGRLQSGLSSPSFAVVIPHSLLALGVVNMLAFGVEQRCCGDLAVLLPHSRVSTQALTDHFPGATREVRFLPSTPFWRVPQGAGLA